MLRRILDDYAQSLQLTLTPAVEVDSIVTTVKLIAATGMYAVLPRSAASNRLADRPVHVRRIVDPTPVRQIACVTHPRRPVNRATSLFIEMLAAHLNARPMVEAASEDVAGSAVAGGDAAGRDVPFAG
ncbi:LysR substrate binding domain [Mycobacteroides abscessus subsp. abscessus]|nr:LysR substrate binding domain [Mycobacteroides abscessus subsp. abscessus]